MVLLAVSAGGVLAVQATANGRLGATVGVAQAALVSLLIAGVILAVVAGLSPGGLGNIRQATGLPWTHFVGGVMGATYLVVSVLVVRSLGSGAAVASILCGQIVASVVIDRFGVLGTATHDLTPARIGGVIAIMTGVVLVTRA